jgi:hypothetical protein
MLPTLTEDCMKGSICDFKLYWEGSIEPLVFPIPIPFSGDTSARGTRQHADSLGGPHP